ncbi:MAG TPA: PAS domain S-box protein [Candidatus Acidoferrum sp.]|nr:PAS domain S-box protein [Candidatus Acidoferrum sp.]
MAKRPLRLLLIDDNPADAELMLSCLKRAGYVLSFDVVDLPEPFREKLQRTEYDLIVSDHNLCTWTGLDALEILCHSGKDIPFIVVTGSLGDEAAVEYIKRGAADYILKHRLNLLPLAVGHALKEKAHRDEKERLHERILAGKREWELTFDAVPDAVLIFDDQCRVRRANRAACEVFGLPFAKLIGRPCYEALHGLVQAPPTCPHEQLLTTGTAQQSDFEEPRLGKIFDATSTPLRDKEGTFLGCIHVLRDISDRNRAEQALRHSEEQLRLLLNSTAEAIYGLDCEGNCTFCNPACLRLLGYRDPKDLLGRNMHQVMHHTRENGTPYLQEKCQIYLAFREGKAAHVVDEVLWRADGTSFPSEYWSYPIEKDGKLVGSVVTFLDISERKHAEAAHRESEEKYREFIENATFGIFRSTPQGELLDVNPALVSMLGYGSKEELLSLNLDRDIYENPPDRMMAWQTYQLTGRGNGIEVNWMRKDRKTISVRLCFRVILDKEDQIKHFEVIAEDVTEKRTLEEQFRQAQKMEAMGRLAGGISHDFNNLLGVIIGYSDLLLASPTRDDVSQHRIEEIKKAGQRAASLTRQLLAFSRKQVLTPKVLDLNTVVAETSKMLLRLLGEDVELITKLSPTLDHVKADPTQIEQVIMNLAINARDAMPKGGKLIIETTNAELDGSYGQQKHADVQPGNYVLLTVSDTGIGMDNATRARIFEPFFTTKERGKGTGLGLATVYGIIRQSGSYIWVYSEVGKGTTFKVYIPRVKESLSEVQPEISTPLHLGSGTILLVEDEDSLRELSHRLLEGMGYTVIEAANGADAIRLAGQCADPIQLLVTDVVMPGMSGRELAELLGAGHSQMKVLYVSGHTDDVIMHYAILKPGVAFLQKPFTRDGLAKKLREVLEVSNGSGGKYLGASQ